MVPDIILNPCLKFSNVANLVTWCLLCRLRLVTDHLFKFVS